MCVNAQLGRIPGKMIEIQGRVCDDLLRAEIVCHEPAVARLVLLPLVQVREIVSNLDWTLGQDLCDLLWCVSSVRASRLLADHPDNAGKHRFQES